MSQYKSLGCLRRTMFTTRVNARRRRSATTKRSGKVTRTEAPFSLRLVPNVALQATRFVVASREADARSDSKESRLAILMRSWRSTGKHCFPRIVGNKEYDFCLECWKGLEEKLRGKGREMGPVEPQILLPDPRESKPGEDEEPQFPGEPPTIWARNLIQHRAARHIQLESGAALSVGRAAT